MICKTECGHDHNHTCADVKKNSPKLQTCWQGRDNDGFVLAVGIWCRAFKGYFCSS